jgi:hypothetical protein
MNLQLHAEETPEEKAAREAAEAAAKGKTPPKQEDKPTLETMMKEVYEKICQKEKPVSSSQALSIPVPKQPKTEEQEKKPAMSLLDRILNRIF